MVKDPIAAVVLGHGAGGGVATADLTAARDAAQTAGLSVVLVEQPYRVAGRRSQPAPGQLDEAWVAIVKRLRETEIDEMALVVGGRSAGARVACRTAPRVDAVAVLCLAFPVHPPGRADDPGKSRLPELDSVRGPTLVIQGERDPFGMPPEGPNRKVVSDPGDHSLRNTAPVAAAVDDWLRSLFPGASSDSRRPR